MPARLLPRTRLPSFLPLRVVKDEDEEGMGKNPGARASESDNVRAERRPFCLGICTGLASPSPSSRRPSVLLVSKSKRSTAALLPRK
jgi:hypothetical protein